MKMKVETVEQYKVLEYIKENFYIDNITLKLIDRYTIEITDNKGDIMNFKYEDGKVVY